MKPTTTRDDELACRELVEVVTDYLEGTLRDDDRHRLERHLEECPYCVEYVEQMRRTATALGDLAPEELSPASRHELLEAFRGWRDR